MKPFFRRRAAVARELDSGVRSDTYLIGVEGGTVPGVREDGSVSGPRTYYRVGWEGRERWS